MFIAKKFETEFFKLRRGRLTKKRVQYDQQCTGQTYRVTIEHVGPAGKK